MKKFLTLFFAFIFSFISIPLCLFSNEEKADAYSAFYTNLNEALNEICSYKTRIAGSENEKDAANFIKGYLKNNTSLSAKNDTSTIDGVQTFRFISDCTGVYETSQNIIFTYTSPTKTDKKVILACHYDAPLYYDSNSGTYISYANDALNASAGNVATLLLLAKYLSVQTLNYNLEFVFFGASESNYAGSEFYVNGLSDETAKNVLCMINIDKVSVGENIYYYVDEIETDFSKYISNVVADKRLGINEINLNHLNKTTAIQNRLGLAYSHIALDSDHVNFMYRGISCINLFAGSYDNGIAMGRIEYNEKESVTYTKNDTREYVTNSYGNDAVESNLYKVYFAVTSILTDSNFVSNAEKSYNQTSLFYKIFTNDDFVVLITCVAFLIMICIALIVYYKLTVKSYYANTETEFLSSIVKITEQIDVEGKDKNIPKAISQVIANDIKKDKTLKPEKDKKNKK